MLATRQLSSSVADRVTEEQEINIQNMNVELAAQMFKNYRSNVLFHLEGKNRTIFFPLLMMNGKADWYFRGFQQPTACKSRREHS